MKASSTVSAVIGPLTSWSSNSSGTRVEFGGTGNALVKASAVRGKLAFDPRYGLSGGEDTDFFYRMWRSGALMVWCQEALLTECVSEERLTIRWLLRRAFGGGQRFADIAERPDGGMRLSTWFAKRSSLAVAASLLTMRYAIKVAANLGQVSTILGYRHQGYRR